MSASAPSSDPKASAPKPEIRKYAFDLVFDSAGHTTLREDRHARRFSQEELETARAEGERVGRANAQAAADAALAAQLEAVAAAARRLEAALETETGLLRQEATKLAFVMAHKAAGRALEHYGAERIIEAFDSALERLGEESRLVVRVHPDAVERLRPRLSETANAHGFAGTLVIRGAAQSSKADMTIEWGDGAMALNHQALLDRMEETLTQDEWGLGPSPSMEP